MTTPDEHRRNATPADCFQVMAGRGNQDRGHLLVWELGPEEHDRVITLLWQELGTPTYTYESTDVETLAAIAATREDLS